MLTPLSFLDDKMDASSDFSCFNAEQLGVAEGFLEESFGAFWLRLL